MSVIPATTSAQPLMPQKKAKNDDEPADCDRCKQQSSIVNGMNSGMIVVKPRDKINEASVDAMKRNSH